MKSWTSQELALSILRHAMHDFLSKDGGFDVGDPPVIIAIDEEYNILVVDPDDNVERFKLVLEPVI